MLIFFCSTAQFAYFYPKIYKHYIINLRRLFNRHPYLRHTFKNSIFPACTFNAGSRAASLKHLDSANSAGGVCPITSGGVYDPTRSGHLILYDWKIYVEFPPASTILIPSASLVHGNTRLQKGETRTSFTQYCAGGLMRWVEYGFRSVKDSPAELVERIDARAGLRWKEALLRFSDLNDLNRDREKLLKV